MPIGTIDPVAPGSDLSAFTRDFERLRRQKSRSAGGVEARILTNLAFYHGEHYVRRTPQSLVAPPLEKHKLFLVFNMVKKLTKRRIGRLSGIAPEFGVEPNVHDAKAYAHADVVRKLIPALDAKVQQTSRQWELYFWLTLAGVAIEHVPWVPDVSVEPVPKRDADGALIFIESATGEELPEAEVELRIQQGEPGEAFTVAEDLRSEGDVGSVIHSPLTFFIDAGVRSIADLAPDQACYFADIKTLGWIEATFGADAAARAKSSGADLSIVTTKLTQRGPALSGTHLADLIPAIQGAQGQDDPDMALVLTRYQPPHAQYPHGRETFFVPGKVILDDRPNPYEAVPAVDYHFEPTATTFWSADFITDMIPGQKFLNKRMSQLGEQANASIYDLVLLGPELAREDIPTDYPGFVTDGINEQGNPMVARLPGPSLPSWFLDSIRITVEFVNNVGASDILQTLPFLGQRRGVTDLPLIQEILDSEDGPVFQHIGTQLSVVKQMRLNRVKQFYPPVRTLNYAGRSNRDEVLVFHTSQILRAGIEFTVTVDRSTITPELFALRAARVNQELSGPMAILYLNPRTNQLDPSKIAKAMRYGDRDVLDRETLARKYEMEAIGRMRRGEVPPPVYPFHPHDVMMDELEAAMLTTEFAESNPQIQQAFFARWQEHESFLVAQAQAQAQAIQNQQIQATIAQVSQQVAAKTAAEATEAAMDQIAAQRQADQSSPILDQVRAALASQEQAPGSTNGSAGPPLV